MTLSEKKINIINMKINIFLFCFQGETVLNDYYKVTFEVVFATTSTSPVGLGFGQPFAYILKL
jgi:hypothetical protein